MEDFFQLMFGCMINVLAVNHVVPSDIVNQFCFHILIFSKHQQESIKHYSHLAKTAKELGFYKILLFCVSTIVFVSFE